MTFQCSYQDTSKVNDDIPYIIIWRNDARLKIGKLGILFLHVTNRQLIEKWQNDFFPCFVLPLQQFIQFFFRPLTAKELWRDDNNSKSTLLKTIGNLQLPIIPPVKNMGLLPNAKTPSLARSS